MLIVLRAAVVFLVASSVAAAQPSSELFARLDRFARTFVSVKASVRFVEHSKVFGDDEPQIGTLLVKRVPGGKTLALIDFTGSDAHTIAFRDQLVEIYHPKLDEIQQYDIRKYRDVVQQMMLLGFGMSGKDLAAKFEIREVRRETVGNEPTTHLELVPKSAEALQHLQRVELWISDKSTCPVEQKFFFPDGNEKTARFSQMQVNQVIQASAFDLPKHAKRVRIN